MKVCTKCKEKKDYELFAVRSTSSDGRSSWCKQCFARNAAGKFKADPNERARKEKNKAASIQRNRDRLWEYLEQHPCVDCGNRDPRVLEFDHRDATLKSCNVTEMFYLSWKSVAVEIAKCDVRCANCHRIRTQDQFGTWKSTHLSNK